MDEVALFCLEEAELDALDGDELLDEIRAYKAAEPDVPRETQRQIDAFREFRT